MIEFSHRMVALVVSLLALGVGIIAIRHRRESGFILKAAIVAGVGIVAQVGLGAAVVLVELQPFLIMAHLAMAFGFLATMIIISLAAQRASQPSPEVLPTASAGEKALLIGTLASLIALLLTGALAAVQRSVHTRRGLRREVAGLDNLRTSAADDLDRRAGLRPRLALAPS